MGHICQQGYVAEHAAVVRTGNEHCRSIGILIAGGLKLIRGDLSRDIIIRIRFRTDIYGIDAAEPECAESGMMGVAAQYELAADRNAGNDSGNQARAGAVHEQLCMAYAIQLCVIIHDITQSAARAEQRVSPRYLRYVIRGGILQKLPVARLIKKRAPAFMPRHVKRNVARRRILIQKICNCIVFHNDTLVKPSLC